MLDPRPDAVDPCHKNAACLTKKVELAKRPSANQYSALRPVLTLCRPRPSGTRRWLLWSIKLTILALMVWFVRSTLVRAAAQLESYPWELSAPWLLLAGLFYATALLPGCWFWFRTLRALGQEVHRGAALRAYYLSQLGKYVPGKAMVVVLRTALVHGNRVNFGIVAASVFFETLTIMSVGAVIGAIVLAAHLEGWSLTVVDRDSAHVLVPAALTVIALAGLPTLPPVFRRLVSWAGVTRGRPDAVELLRTLGWGTLAFGWIASAAVWGLLGCSLWATCRAVGVNEPSLFSAMGDYQAVMALATVAGFLSMIPAGLGVRDVALVSLLIAFFAVPEGIAVVTACLQRITWLTTELVISGSLWLTARCRPVLTTFTVSAETRPLMSKHGRNDT